MGEDFERSLEQLAELCGILPGYLDDQGMQHWTSPGTRRALLSAMGFDVESAGAVQAAIAARLEDPWRRALPPVCVVVSGAAQIELPLAVPDQLADVEWGFRIDEESGALREGSVRPQALERMDARDIDGEPVARYRWRLPDLPTGYHAVSVAAGERSSGTTLIVAPERCYVPAALHGEERVWGPTFELPAVRSHRNWGAGDLTDLSRLLEIFASAGAGMVGLGPLHSLLSPHLERFDPYRPACRLFWNALLLDVEALPGLADCETVQARLHDPVFRARVAAARDQAFIDPAEVNALKLEILAPAFAYFRHRVLGGDTDLAQAFRTFRDRAGNHLDHQALFEALAEYHGTDAGAAEGSAGWPPGYESPESPAVQAFAAAHSERIEFFAWLQWLLEMQLDAAATRAAELGLGVGLRLDLSSGAGPSGGEVWSGGDVHARRVTLGVPPSETDPRGQNWGLTPWIPERLKESAYAPFVDLLRRNMAHAGALQLDVPTMLMRAYWIPAGEDPADGAYVAYPQDDLLGIIALESQRQRCVVIDAGIGGPASGRDDALASMGVLSSRVLLLARGADERFPAPEAFPESSQVSLTRHDLPTLRGYWQGEDIALRRRLEPHLEDDAWERLVVERSHDRARLLFALQRHGLLPEGVDQDPLRVPDMSAALVVAVHRYVARSPAKVVTFRLGDAFGMRDLTNVPEGQAGQPGVRHRLPLSLEDFSADDRLNALLSGLREERGVSARRRVEVPRTLVVPRATYRLQVSSRFTFADAARLVPYLARLGVSHCYLSPFLKARPGSGHGYDVIDHGELNPEIGSRTDLEALAAALREAGMGIIADMVPNHMGVMGADNAWWLDVLENGEASRYAEYFDIDWQPVRPELRDKVLVPILGDLYGAALEGGDLRLSFDAEAGTLAVYYHQHQLPLDPTTYPRVLALDLEVLEDRLGREHVDFAEFESVIHAFEQLPGRNDPDPEQVETRRREQVVAKRRLAGLCQRCQRVREHVVTNVVRLSGVTGEPESFAALHELLQRQAWRVAHWQVAADEINYRRFFDVNELAALRIEHGDLLQQTHGLMVELYRGGLVDGLRIDHPDGLYDPAGYFDALQTLLTDDGAATSENGAARCYLVAEKILASHEHLPECWRIDGTTGYDFGMLVNGLTVDPQGEPALTRCYVELGGGRRDFDDVLYECKKLVIRVHLSSELTNLASLANRIAQADWHTRDFTLNGIRDALAEVVAAFPVYRTYVTPARVSADDRNHVEWALALARRRDPETNPDLYDFIRRLLLLELGDDMSASSRRLCERFAMKFQQYTSPVMAKALEDTAYYRFGRLLSLNEVGGDPRWFGISVSAFHHQNRARLRRWPHTMLAGSTHDSKRSEDVRARLNVLSELADEWRGRVGQWQQMNRHVRSRAGDCRVPTRLDEYLYYQSLVGVWPLTSPDDAMLESLADRLSAYMIKAVREAKDSSGWIHPDADYEARLTDFVRASLDGTASRRFLGDVDQFAQRLGRFGVLNSLTGVALRLTAPGVPDIYQGDELWRFDLVDPDNRRPVDFEKRMALLDSVERCGPAQTGAAPFAAPFEALLEAPADGRVKMHLCWRLLQLRRQHESLFAGGEYLPLTVGGARAEHVCAFVRRDARTTVVVLAGRWFARLQAGGDEFLPNPASWQDTWVDLPDGVDELHEVLGGGTVRGASGRLAVARVLAPQPVAVLVAGSAWS